VNQLPRENVYTCEKCARFTVTVDVDEGVTPFMLKCRASGKEGDCDGTAYSACYPTNPRPSWMPAPAWEWFKPTGSEYNKLSEAMKRHVDKGGLDIRHRTAALPVMHKR
jgi:hypothetical protein